MEFRSSNPGAVQYGNFMNYYQFNSAEERLNLVRTEHWLAKTDGASPEPYLVLDVGCNAGVFTELLYRYLKNDLLAARPVCVLGVDIDEVLVKRAIAESGSCGHITYVCVDVMDREAFLRIEQFLQKHKRTQFDAVCCFSITMWIHLNHHDEGLRDFLRKLSLLAKLFVVEPQPWKCYQTAERRMKRAGEGFPLFLELKWRFRIDLEIQDFLEELGRKKVFESCPTRWKRKILFYR